MVPTLQQGDEATIEPVSSDALCLGDLVVIRGESRGFLHRYLGRWRDRIVTKGDGRRYLDPLWTPEHVLGRVVEVRRDSKCIYRWTERDARLEWLRAQWHRAYGGFWHMLRTLKSWIAIIVLLLVYVLPVLAAVTLTDFSVAPGEQEVFVYWETASETGNLGFYVWRSEEADAGYEKLPLDSPAEQFIPSEDQGVGYFYEYMDSEVTPGVVYYYKVQDVPDDGSQGEYSEVRSASIADETTSTDTPTPTTTATATSTPTPQQDGEPEGVPIIRFWASETILDAGDCATIQWQTENVESVYFDGEGVAGQGARSFCPCNDETHVLTVYLRGGGAEERSITLDTIGSCSEEASPIATPSLSPSPTPSPSSTPRETPETSTSTPTPQAQLTIVVPTATSTPTLMSTAEDLAQTTPSSTLTSIPDNSSSEPADTPSPTPFVTRAVVEGGSRRTSSQGNRVLILGVGALFGLVLIGGGVFLWKRWR